MDRFEGGALAEVNVGGQRRVRRTVDHTFPPNLNSGSRPSLHNSPLGSSGRHHADLARRTAVFGQEGDRQLALRRTRLPTRLLELCTYLRPCSPIPKADNST